MIKKDGRPRAALRVCVYLLLYAGAALALKAVPTKDAPALAEDVIQAAAVLAAACAAGRAITPFVKPQFRGALLPTACWAAFAAVSCVFLPTPEIVGGKTALAAALLGTCLTGPISEELVFRGAVQNELEPFGRAGIVIQAALFALTHKGAASMGYAFIAGLLFGWLRERTGSVWPGAVLHGINNALATALALWG